MLRMTTILVLVVVNCSLDYHIIIYQYTSNISFLFFLCLCLFAMNSLDQLDNNVVRSLIVTIVTTSSIDLTIPIPTTIYILSSPTFSQLMLDSIVIPFLSAISLFIAYFNSAIFDSIRVCIIFLISTVILFRFSITDQSLPYLTSEFFQKSIPILFKFQYRLTYYNIFYQIFFGYETRYSFFMRTLLFIYSGMKILGFLLGSPLSPNPMQSRYSFYLGTMQLAVLLYGYYVTPLFHYLGTM